nr:ribonuclease H-like domain-containing protein [Tanacetum cinerariifolium]
GHSHKQIEDQGYFDSGCSWHMTGNISYHTDFKEFDKGYVAFGGGAKDSKITRKGTIRTGKLDFEDGHSHKQIEDQGYFDSGCSWHMTGNISYHTDFKEFDKGYVAFGGGAKDSKITRKGTIRTGKLDFEDVYFVKELQFNLFSVSRMCDKKNIVFFTDTKCFVMSHDFKLADESHVLLKVPRKNNMYSVDIKNIAPKKI